MTKKYIITSMVAITIIAVTVGATTTVRAYSSNSSTSTVGREKFKGEKRSELTEAQKAEMKTKIEAINAKQKINAEAVKKSLEIGDYNTWVAATKAINANSFVLTKINATNFSKYVEAHKLQTQAQNILKELGINNGEIGGPRGGHSEGRGMGLKIEGGAPMPVGAN
jgi:hypothetical protein